MTNWPTKKLNVFRYLTYWTHLLFTVGLPIILVAWQFEIFKKPGATRVTGLAIVATILAFFILGKHLKKAISDLEPGVAKTVLHNLTMLLPLFIFWVILTFLEVYLSKVKFILFWVMIGILAAAFLDMWHTFILKEIHKREKR